MKNYGKITENKDLVTKEYVDKIGKPELRIGWTMDDYTKLKSSYFVEINLSQAITKNLIDSYQIIFTNPLYSDFKSLSCSTLSGDDTFYVFNCDSLMGIDLTNSYGTLLHSVQIIAVCNEETYFGAFLYNTHFSDNEAINYIKSFLVFPSSNSGLMFTKNMNDAVDNLAGGIYYQNGLNLMGSQLAIMNLYDNGFVCSFNNKQLTYDVSNSIINLNEVKGENIKIKSLAAGEEDTDAVNLSQLNEVKNFIPIDYIKSIKVNGEEQEIDENKAVDIDLNNYLKLTDDGYIPVLEDLITEPADINGTEFNNSAGIFLIPISKIGKMPVVGAKYISGETIYASGLSCGNGQLQFIVSDNQGNTNTIGISPQYNEDNNTVTYSINGESIFYVGGDDKVTKIVNGSNSFFDLYVPTPTTDNQAANKKYVDDSIATVSSKANYEITLGTEWSGDAAPYTQSVAVEGILATDNPHIVPIYSDTLTTAIAEQEAWNCVSKAETAVDTITFTCFADKPTAAVSLQVEVIR